MLLSDVEPELYQEEIGLIVDGLLQRQRPSGGWSYHPYTYDDTSQTQYAVLCLWTAAQNGHQVPAESLESAANWLITTQHPEGGWSYIPLQLPDIGIPRNHAITHSMASAGAGMIYMLAHLFGLGISATDEQTGLPPALKPVDDQQRRGLFPADRVNRTAFRECHAFGGQLVCQEHAIRCDLLDALLHVRLRAVQELSGSRQWPDGEGPGLVPPGRRVPAKRTQQPDGSWKSTEAPNSTAAIDTAFAVLFLARSSQQTINKTLLEGQLRSGQGVAERPVRYPLGAAGRSSASRPSRTSRAC